MAKRGINAYSIIKHRSAMRISMYARVYGWGVAHWNDRHGYS